MKKLKRIVALLLATIMSLAMTLTAFAAASAKVTVKNAPEATKVYAFKLLNVTGKEGGVYDYSLNDNSIQIKNALKESLHLEESFTAEDVYNGISGKANTLDEFANDFVKAMGRTALQNATANASTTNESAQFDNLEDGYYLFYIPNVNSAIKTIIAGNDNNVNMKTDLPDLDKDSDVQDKGVDAGAQIGRVVNFTVITKVPNIVGFDEAKYVFKLTDTLSEGLDFVQNVSNNVDVKVQIDGKGTEDSATGILTGSGKRTMTVDLADIVKDNQTYAGKKMTITYQAIVNKNAVINNNNRAEIEYSNKPGTEETGKTKPDIEYVPTYDLKVKKTASDTNNYLAGAIFTLRKETATGEEIKVEGQGGVYTYAVDQTSKNTQMTTVGDKLAEGEYNLQLKGLKAGTYYLVEETAPDKYNKLEPVKIVITGTPGVEGVSAGNYTITVGDPGKVEDDKIIDLVNKKGSILPETGGIGTVVFTAIAVILIAGVAISFAMSRRKKEN